MGLLLEAAVLAALAAALAVVDEEDVEVVLEVVWHAAVEVLVGRLARGGGWHPAQLLGDVPHVRVHGELRAAEREPEHAGHGLGAHALSSGIAVWQGRGWGQPDQRISRGRLLVPRSWGPPR